MFNAIYVYGSYLQKNVLPGLFPQIRFCSWRAISSITASDKGTTLKYEEVPYIELIQLRLS